MYTDGTFSLLKHVARGNSHEAITTSKHPTLDQLGKERRLPSRTERMAKESERMKMKLGGHIPVV